MRKNFSTWIAVIFWMCIININAAYAVIAFDAASQQSISNSTTLSWNHTCSGSNRVLVVGVVVDAGVTISGVTYNGVAMPQNGGQQTGAIRTGFFRLTNPSTGTNTIVVTTSASSTRILGGAVSFTGNNNASLNGTATSPGNTANPNNGSNSGTAAAGKWCVDMLAGESQQITVVGALQTERVNIFDNYSLGMSTEPYSGSNPIPMSWTMGANNWTHTRWVLNVASCSMTSSANTTNVSCFGANNGSATGNPSSGSSPYTYSWTSVPVQTSQTATGLSPGTYTVTVTDNAGCSATASATITEPASGVTASAAKTDVTCNGGNNGTATATPGGGTSPYTYSWSPSGGTGANATGLTAGTYTVTITDNSGCTKTATASVSQSPTLLSASIGSSTNITCTGSSNGSATVTPGNGTSPYTYVWSPSGGTAATATGLSAGTYTATVTDQFGCTKTTTVVLAQSPVLLTAAIGSTKNITCTGSSDGTATVNPNNGTSPYTYSWSPSGGTSITATGLSSGTYTATVTDIFGCSRTASATIAQSPSLLTAAINGGANVTCTGSNDGTATVTPGNGTSPYTYVWGPSGGTSTSATGLSAGTYTVTVTDLYGCSRTTTTTINQSSGLLSVNIGNTIPVTCTGSGNGSATVTTGNGTSPYTYQWSPSGGTGITATGLSGGIYTATVTDNYGCTKTTSVTINESAGLLSLSTVPAPVTCAGNNNGSVNLTPAQGTAPYTYSWSSGPVTQNISGLSPGIYTATVTDSYGCSRTATETISEPAALTGSTTQGNVACNGGNNGSATSSPNGGTSPYTYSWSSGGTANSISGLTAGNYTVTITDNRGCTNTNVVTISQAGTLSATDLKTDVDCKGANSGSVDVTTTGGTSPYTYNWSGGATTEDRNNLSAGNYTLTVTDNLGCQSVLNIAITEPAQLTSGTSGIDANCFGGTDGSVTASAGGGTSPYTYSWNNGPTTASNTGLSAGTYTITVTDNKGCSSTGTAAVSEPTQPLQLNPTSGNVTCAGSSNGSATVTSTGATAPYTYNWNTIPAQTTPTATGLSGGSYTVTVTDNKGCISTTSVVIQESPQPLLPNISGNTSVSCTGSSDGSATVTLSGGTSPYTYNWSTTPSQTTSIVTGLPGGIYTVTVSDILGCTTTGITIINESTQNLGINISNNTPVICTGSGNGSATVTTTGGTGPFTYLWGTTPSQTTPAVSNLSGGTYTVTVTDQNGCSRITTVLINESTQNLAINVTAQDESCSPGGDGSATVNPAGGTGPYTYSWSGNGISGSGLLVSGLNAGTYTVTVMDNYGCSRTATGTVGAKTGVTASFTADPPQGSFPLGVTFTNTSTGGTTYLWTFGDNSSDTVKNPVHLYTAKGDYTVRLITTNQWGCVDTFYFFIRITEKSRLVIPNIFTPNHDGNNDLFPLIENGIDKVRGVIYNRWGELINKFDTVNGGWDGRTAAGEEVPDGVYYYIISATGSDGAEYQSHGFITLVR